MEPIIELEKQGYCVWLADGLIQFEYRDSGKPNPATVRPLLDKLKSRKAEAIRYLQQRRGSCAQLAEPHEVAELLRTQGWAAIRSGALGNEVVVWVRDEQVIVPPPWQYCVRYTRCELEMIADNPRARGDGLREIHEAKRVFDGTVCGAEQDR